MLVRFSLDNWMSFKNPTIFSMIASKERQHSERVPQVEKYAMRILPISAIYGGNASGKTNLFKAISFAKQFIEKGTQSESSIIPVQPYRLDAEDSKRPTNFSFEILIDDVIHEYSFSVTRKEVIEEKLVKINASSERILFLRQNGVIELDKTLDDLQFLQFVFRGTRDNQLFLTNSVSQKIDTFKPVYNWFKDNLVLVAPDSRFGNIEQLMDESDPLHEMMNTLLRSLDTGITHLGGNDIRFDELDFPEDMKLDIQQAVTDESKILVRSEDENIIVSRSNGELIAKKLISFHSSLNGVDVEFDIIQESDGTRRIIDLLPAFISVSENKSKKVYIIDELDRSLHTLLTRQLIENYLTHCSNSSRSQLIFTTHDVLLMDQDIFRRDEMWVAERDQSGVSKLLPLSDYKEIRYDKDIRKSYLQGRLGGIPRLLIDHCA